MKILFISIFTLSTLFSKGQIGTPVKESPSVTIGKIAPVGSFIMELSYRSNPEDPKDTTYTIRFRDYTYTHITSIKSMSFSGIDGTVDKLYDLFKSVFAEENRSNKDYAVTFTLGKELVQIANFKSMGTTMAMLLVGKSYGLLTEKQVDKLFGK